MPSLGSELVMIACAIGASLAGRASSGWWPLGWEPPGRLYQRLWAALLAILVALAHPTPWWVPALTFPLLLLSRVEQTRWFETHWKPGSAAMLGLIGGLQALAVLAPLAAARLDPWTFAWVAVGALRGLGFYATGFLPKEGYGPAHSIIDARTALAEVVWYPALAITAMAA